ncbi:MAG: hypothetical protein C4B59_16900 [Candidatus Methanogaster sp.]|uniref:Uncharacterized protein n=1 Tax=Candidatus Methanogaster sp. TaxID=3386292 RepID=A0AC61KY23_9EURY|nr:MAG: hypothetical protein C4B59_16900 [ANME-2 cluster archaeon]
MHVSVRAITSTRSQGTRFGVLYEHVRVIPPVGYLDMLKLMTHSMKILTDSGGVQKEAYMLGVPCVTLRENTEWVETVEDGWNVLVGADYGAIVDAIRGFEGAGRQSGVFGRGNASERILEILRPECISCACPPASISAAESLYR